MDECFLVSERKMISGIYSLKESKSFHKERFFEESNLAEQNMKGLK